MNNTSSRTDTTEKSPLDKHRGTPGNAVATADTLEVFSFDMDMILSRPEPTVQSIQITPIAQIS